MRIRFVDSIFQFLDAEKQTFALSEKVFLSEIDAVSNRYERYLDSGDSNWWMEIKTNKWLSRFSDKELEHFCQVIAICTDNENVAHMRVLYYQIRELIETRGNILMRFLPEDIFYLKNYLLDRYYKNPQGLLDLVRDGFCDKNGKSHSLAEIFEDHYPVLILLRQRKLPRTKVFRKGYDDKGSLGKDIPDKYIRMTLEQKEEEQKEQQRKILLDTHDFIRGFVE